MNQTLPPSQGEKQQGESHKSTAVEEHVMPDHINFFERARFVSAREAAEEEGVQEDPAAELARLRGELKEAEVSHIVLKAKLREAQLSSDAEDVASSHHTTAAHECDTEEEMRCFLLHSVSLPLCFTLMWTCQGLLNSSPQWHRRQAPCKRRQGTHTHTSPALWASEAACCLWIGG